MAEIEETTYKNLKEEIFTHMLETFDLLADIDKLDDFLANLSQKERDELYSHPLLENYDLLP